MKIISPKILIVLALLLVFAVCGAVNPGNGVVYAQEDLSPDTESGGTYFSVPKQPLWPEPAWEVGNSLTYHITVTKQADAMECDLRVAVLSREVVATEALYWIEFDITNISGLSAEDQAFFIDNYGEIPTAFRVKMEIPRSNLVDIFLHPSEFYMDFSEIGYIEGLVFQYNRQVPYNVDPSLLGGFILPLGLSMFLGDNIPEDFYDNRNIGVEVIEDEHGYMTESSESELSVEAGTFDGRLYSWTGIAPDRSTGSLFYSNTMPIFPVIMIDTTFNSDSSTGHFQAELISLETSGASSQIVGNTNQLTLREILSMGM